MIPYRQTGHSTQGWKSGLRLFVCLIFLTVSGLGPVSLTGAVGLEERAEVAGEWSLETAGESRLETREDQLVRCQTVYLSRFARVAGKRLAVCARRGIGLGETAPSPLRC